MLYTWIVGSFDGVHVAGFYPVAVTGSCFAMSGGRALSDLVDLIRLVWLQMYCFFWKWVVTGKHQISKNWKNTWFFECALPDAVVDTASPKPKVFGVTDWIFQRQWRNVCMCNIVQYVFIYVYNCTMYIRVQYMHVHFTTQWKIPVLLLSVRKNVMQDSSEYEYIGQVVCVRLQLYSILLYTVEL